MMPAPQSPPGYRIGQAVYTQEEYAELLKARQRVSEAFIHAAVDVVAWFLPPLNDAALIGRRDRALDRFQKAACQFLTVDVQFALEGIAKNPTNQRPEYPPVTVEDLARVTLELETAERRTEQLAEALEHGENLPPGFGAVIESAIMPQLESAVRNYRQQRDFIQAALDQQQPPRPPSADPARGAGSPDGWPKTDARQESD